VKPRDRQPRFALVAYPDNTIGCIFLAALDDAIAKGAFVFAREFEPEPAPERPGLHGFYNDDDEAQTPDDRYRS
jgi:hypothetical protein